jgi:hypothetical protein
MCYIQKGKWRPLMDKQESASPLISAPNCGGILVAWTSVSLDSLVQKVVSALGFYNLGLYVLTVIKFYE